MMSVLIYVLLLSTIPYLSTGFDTYRIIRNASINITFDDHGYKLEAESCNQCLCNAFNNASVVLFTCTQNESKNYSCQFYNFMPTRDKIQYPINDTSIYLIQINNAFEEDDCCNTAYLVQAIKKTTSQKYFTGTHFRSIVEGDNNTIVAVITNSAKQLIKFDKSTLNKIVDVTTITPLKAVGYYDKKYYLGTNEEIHVYNENLSALSTPVTIRIGSAINTIRFLNSKSEMLVGTLDGHVHVYGKDEDDGILKKCTQSLLKEREKQLHAIGVVNENAFYVGWAAEDQNIHLYRRDQSNTWTTDDNDRINDKAKTSDIVIDDCKRIWAVTEGSGPIRIHDQNKSASHIINLFGSELFNLIILANYTLIGAHASTDGIWRIQPSLNCRPPR